MERKCPLSTKLLIEKTSIFTKYAVLDDKKLKYIKIIKRNMIKYDEIYLGKIIKKNLVMKGYIVDILGEEVFLVTNENLPIGEKVLVKIEREEEKGKRARASLDISISNKYAVILGAEKGFAFSKKIDESDRALLTQEYAEFNTEEYGILLRTDIINQDTKEVKVEIRKLIEKYKEIKFSSSLGLKYSPYDEKILSDILTKHSVYKIEVNDKDLYNKLKKIYSKSYEVEYNDIFLFNHNGVNFDELLQSEKNFETFKLTFNYLEALILIDVDSGYIKKDKERDAKIFEINKNAFLKILDIISLYELGGVIIVDFISLNNKLKNKLNDFVEKTLKSVYNSDRKFFASKLTESCLLEIIVEKRNKNLVFALSQKCEKCGGSGLLPNKDIILDDFEIMLQSYLSANEDKKKIDLELPVDYLAIEPNIRDITKKYNLGININYTKNIKIK